MGEAEIGVVSALSKSLLVRNRYESSEHLAKGLYKSQPKSGTVAQMAWACYAGAEKGPTVEMVQNQKGGGRGSPGGYLKALQSSQNIIKVITNSCKTMPQYIPQSSMRMVSYTVMEWPLYSPDQPHRICLGAPQENLHENYPEFINMSGNVEAITPKLAGAIIHHWELLDPSIFDMLASSMPGG